MTEKQKFSEGRKTDRQKMAAALAAEVVAAGATAVVEPDNWNPHRINVKIEAPGGAHITADLTASRSSTRPSAT